VIPLAGDPLHLSDRLVLSVALCNASHTCFESGDIGAEWTVVESEKGGSLVSRETD
jgi:hypothetical protein